MNELIHWPLYIVRGKIKNNRTTEWEVIVRKIIIYDMMYTAIPINKI